MNSVKGRIPKGNSVLIKLGHFLSVIEIWIIDWSVGLLKFRNSRDTLFYFERFFGALKEKNENLYI